VSNLLHKIVLQFYAILYLFTPHVASSIFPRFVPSLCRAILLWMGLLELPALYLGSPLGTASAGGRPECIAYLV
jgi:hypothetical protein